MTNANITETPKEKPRSLKGRPKLLPKPTGKVAAPPSFTSSQDHPEAQLATTGGNAGSQTVNGSHYTNAASTHSKKQRTMAATKPTLATSSAANGHATVETRNAPAVSISSKKRATLRAKPTLSPPAADDHVVLETQCSPVIGEIRELWKRRQNWHRAEKSLTIQAFAVCRRYCGGDKEEAAKMLAKVEKGELTDSAVVISCSPLLAARAPLEKERAILEAHLKKLAGSLPVAPWIVSIRGVALPSLGAIVGECGDIGSYKSVSALWKRMGLAVIGGERQRKKLGIDALEHGYSPERRSIMWNIGTAMIRAMKPEDPYRMFYDQEKEKQLKKEGITPKWAHNRAMRHMTKRFLADLYGQWTGRRAILVMKPMPDTSAAPELANHPS